MANVHPETLDNSCYSSSDRKTFTVWMKSLVIHSNGCTVFNSSGQLVFRVDNYHTRRSTQVFLMNLTGQVLFSIKAKRLPIFGVGVVEGYKWTNNKDVQQCFKISGKCNLFGRDSRVIQRGDETTRKCYNNIIENEQGKSTLEIMDSKGRILAEVMPKQSSEGFSLGDDVFTLSVEPQIDQSLIMALVIAHGMINRKM